MLEIDLILALNEALQRVRKNLKIHFCRIKYLPFRVISALLTKKANARLLIFRLLNILI